MKFNHTNENDLPFVDFLFNILLVFVVVIAILLILKVSEGKGVPQPEPYMVILTWDDDSKDDVDLWVETEYGVFVSYKKKEDGFMFLEKDDLGASSDTIKIDGKDVTVKQNREVLRFKDIVPDKQYRFNIHLYNEKDEDGLPTNVKIEFLQTKPFLSLFTKEFEMTERGELVHGFNVSFDDQKKIDEITSVEYFFVYKYLSPTYLNQSGAIAAPPQRPNSTPGMTLEDEN